MQIHYEQETSKGFDSKQVIVKLTDGTSIKGWINLRNNTRISDLLNNYEAQFIVLFNCTLREELGNVIFVNRNHILWAAPVEK
ncbi:MAG: hypothetical protein U5L00_18140 [Desulfovermiculus sp.]|nr:hypothetical protein [Desulfovermiculus sp.]